MRLTRRAAPHYDSRMTDLTRFNRLWNQNARAEARRVAERYIEAHRDVLAPVLGNMTREQMVVLVESYRAAGRDDERTVADMWLLTQFEPQNIEGRLAIGGQAAIEAAEALLKENARGPRNH